MFEKQRGMLSFVCFLFTLFGPYVLQNHKKTVGNQPNIVKNGGPGWFWGLLGEAWEAFWSQGGPKLKKSCSLAALGVPFGEDFWTPFGTESFQIDFVIVFFVTLLLGSFFYRC